MNSVAAFFFGVLVTIIILVIFWLLANIIPSINTTYKNSVCYGIYPFTATSALGGNPQTTNSVV